MSRRKQTKPQHLKSDEEALQTDSLSKKAVLLNGLDEEENSREARSEESHVCERCCAEFFTWTELCDHQTVCTVDPLVLIVKDGEDMSPAGLSPSPSMDTCDSADMDYTDGGNELAETLNHHSNQDFQEASKEDKPMELEQLQEKHATASLESTNSSSQQMTSVTSYGMPTTNVTLEILHSTSVAVAQFSQGISSSKNGGKAATASIPVLLEHLVVLQQQQVQQLQLIEQIRSQVAIMNRQPTLTALNPASRALALAPNHLPSQGPVTTPVLPLSGTMPSVINGQASVTMSSDMSSGSHSGQSNSREVTCTLPSSHASSSTTSSSISTPLPLYTGSHTSVGSGQTTSSSSVLSLGQSSLLSTSSSLPFLTQSPPGGVIFPNPLASIAATANALDPLAALMKNRKGKLPNVSIFDTKPSPEEPFFKHKCRFCAKVFGSDSALQIHLRSHTGERPFKCNICGNRFSTKGNLKVHFQRHKEKYPHVQMNPYPVPEYLDNVPTSSGIPYGMSFPPEKPGSSWLESKPVLATPPSSAAHQLPTTLGSMGSSNDSGSVTPSMKSPYRPASSECASLSPNRTNSEPHVPPYCFESPQCNRLGETSYAFKSEGVPLPQNCTTRPRLSPPVTTATNTTATPTVSTQEPSPPASPPPNPSLSLASDQSKANFPFGGLLVDSMQTSETSKLQQLVENIDKKITDPNQCVLCHRVLSCQSSLKMHYRIHTGERPFKCKVCGRAFSTKGNLKTHFSVHRSNPPLQVLHSCPICQKKFTNAVVLQQHIRMHMGGQISNSPHMEGLQERDADLSYVENFDSLSGHDNDFSDDVSMDEEDEGAEEETSNLEGIEDPVRNFSSVCCSPPKSSEVVSSIAALENQMRMIDSTVSLNHAFGINSLLNGFIDRDRFTIISSSTERKVEDPNSGSPTMSESSSCTNIPASPLQSTLQSSGEGHTHMSPADTHRSEAQVVAAKVKNEQTESPTSAMGHGMPQELRESQLSKHWIKKEGPYSLLFQQSRECVVSQSISSLVNSTPSNMIKTEMNGHSRTNPANEGHWQQQTLFGFHLPATYSSMESPVMTSLIGPAPPRRTPKQHNCSACGKNFSSASALQIHERTHTGEKPFGCSICGRAFTTKGNLKVHMGTHMWNNAPARRGRRLSLENPMALLGGDAMKFGEMFQKDLAARAMNVDPGFWNRYAAAITNGLAMKNNEISVIQNGGIPHLHALTAGMDRVSTGNSQTITSLGKSGMELGINRHFSMLIDDSKEIGIN